MTNETNGTIDTHNPQGSVVLLQGEGGDQYLLPVEVLEACRVDDTLLTALRDNSDVAGYLEWGSVLKDYAVYRMDGGVAGGRSGSRVAG